MNRNQDEKCLWTWIWTTDGAENETEEPEPEQVQKPSESPPKLRRTSRIANRFVAQDLGRNNLTSKQSGNLWGNVRLLSFLGWGTKLDGTLDFGVKN